MSNRTPKFPSAWFAPGQGGNNDWRLCLGIIGVIAAVATLLYYPSLHAPWYMDDTGAILQNPRVRDIGNSFRDIFFNRGLATLSFSVNYRLGGTDPFGYHLVNLGLHIGCGFLVFLLLQPVVQGRVLLAALGALLFVAHPLQTQAVTYIVQRMTILSALFFFLAVFLFTKAREKLAAELSFFSAKHLGYYLGALVAGLGAITCKENTAVLPVALYLYVVFFLPPHTDRKRLVLSLIPFVIAPLWIAMVRLFVPLADGASLVAITRTTDLLRSQQLTPMRYMVTELSVLWVYIRMLFLPYGQALDHSYPLATSLFAFRHLLAGSGLVLLAGLAVRLRRSQPLIAAGIGWFFLTLAVESSFIPLDPLFEHRLYLPMFGFVLVILGLLRLLPGRGTGIAFLALAVLVCLPLAWQRNRLWAEPINFYRDNVAKVPFGERVLSELARKYIEANRLDEAEPLLLRALQLNPDYLPAYIDLVTVYNDQHRLQEGITLARAGLTRYPGSDRLRTSLAALYYNSGDLERALNILNQELAIHPNYAPARDYLAKTLVGLGRWSEAEAALRQIVAFGDADLGMRNELAVVLLQQGKVREAEEELQRVIAADSQNSNALFNLALLATERGDRAQVTVLSQRLRRSDPQRAQELEQLIRAER